MAARLATNKAVGGPNQNPMVEKKKSFLPFVSRKSVRFTKSPVGTDNNENTPKKVLSPVPDKEEYMPPNALK